MHLVSGAFQPGQPLPPPITCDGVDTSPPLAWDRPQGPSVESYVIVLDDPDAPGGRFSHWTLFNLSPSLTEIPGGLARELTLPRWGATHGRNDFGTIGYRGPCPPSGARHRYVFRIFALDTRIALGPGASRAAVEDAMRGHVRAAGTLTGTYAH